MDAHDRVVRAAARWQRRLPETVLPYWLSRTDERDGGYLLAEDLARSWARRVGRRVLRGPLPPTSDDKQLVGQARLTWVLSHAHCNGYGTGQYLRGATAGYEFLLEHFLDETHGGYHWATDRGGRLLNPVKHLYGQAFVVYGFVEYARASGDGAALQHALELHRVVDEHLHDDVHGGWREHGNGDWQALTDLDPRVEVGAVGYKGGNALIHWIEALTALAADTSDTHVRRSLDEALACGLGSLFPADPAMATEQCLSDWTPDPAPGPLSYGHNVEFVWLMARAQQVLGGEPSWGQFRAYLDHTLRNGFDHRRGGAYTFGREDERAHARHKLAWVQNELIAALTDALVERDSERYTTALAQTLDFVDRHMIDRSDGIMLQSVHENGRRQWPMKSGYWKAGYHEVRAWVKLVRAFAP